MRPATAFGVGLPATRLLLRGARLRAPLGLGTGIRLGNIFNQPFDEIFFSERNRAYVETMDVEANNDVCRSCEVRFLCGGGCKANTLHSIGDHRGVDLYCGYLRTTITDELFRSCGVEVESEQVPTGSNETIFLGMPDVGGAGDNFSKTTMPTSV
ncbi:SPASM domain-containing protein [Streptomyces sp. NEAU-174]|uniref:SPASM domain-containing protein n=1 Tax=Streptomyces sp. NEAU-174 TaxID=3458254 RepID=UPI004043C0D2